MHFSFTDELCVYRVYSNFALPTKVPTMKRIPAFLVNIFWQENVFNGIL